ncbi:MAG: protein-L-isoaspartate carboxylmethyltransferase, partial [Rhodococcus sp.]|nr:protein-L-isoaspartate carboxylmethyltransferase [Rhodococcus sp. (in: high G+C Gram-positive bacteria)]
AAVAEGNTPWADVVLATPGVLGLPDEAPFDRILVSAEAQRDVPADLIDQLGPDGVMVIPVRGVMLRVVRPAVGDPTLTSHGWYSFVPLIED